MTEPGREYEVISVSLPRDLVARINEIVPRTRRSRIIRELLSSSSSSRRAGGGSPRSTGDTTRAGPPEAEEERTPAGRAGNQRRGGLGHSRARGVPGPPRNAVTSCSPASTPRSGWRSRKTRPVVVCPTITSTN